MNTKVTIENQREYFQSGSTLSYEFRIKQLKKLKQALYDNKEQIVAALASDLGRPEFEAYFELSVCYHELEDTIKQLKKWMKPKKVKTGILAQPAKSRIEYVPVGNVLIITPFNYPIILAFQPLIGAIAAGNTAIIKPSEINPACTKVVDDIVKATFDEHYVSCLPGEIDVTTRLLEEKFDHIFFTGSARVGRIVMAAAAKHLTPVTLELGGKSPTIVDKDCDLNLAVKRIASGKFLNAGQTCIAPDHVYVHEDVKTEFIEKLKQQIEDSYTAEPINSPDLGRIINERHFKRVRDLIPQDKVVIGGQSEASTKFIAPTLVKDVTFDDDIMHQEIFGPVLPVLSFSSFENLKRQIDKLPHNPLAMYIFTNDKQFEHKLIQNVRCGGVNVNSTLMHVVNSYLPFGGSGESGMGAYHGKYSFDLFSHKKSVINSATWVDVPLRYAPYGDKVKWLKRLIR